MSEEENFISSKISDYSLSLWKKLENPYQEKLPTNTFSSINASSLPIYSLGGLWIKKLCQSVEIFQ